MTAPATMYLGWHLGFHCIYIKDRFVVMLAVTMPAAHKKAASCRWKIVLRPERIGDTSFKPGDVTFGAVPSRLADGCHNAKPLIRIF
ncbi:hypothetical protein [Caulobacter sp. BE254]|uniref:hypothetical protein n=1 Tax=Caulobacter sp. BE254 TaxID=2817720 RepID=UPI00285EC272|nr:hypothetical protein [Caulobacter sp. BE254]MDR7115612.1 hypothetical protein [Caulobacter sp. BE254]